MADRREPTEVRNALFTCAGRAAALLARPEVAAAWDRPSALAGLSVAGLAGHLLRATVTIEDYLAGPEPSGEPLDAPGYFAAVVGPPDLDSPGNRAVRARAVEMAAGGAAAVAAQAGATLERLRGALPTVAGDRRMTVAAGLVVTLEAYLATRIVELVVHSEDLALSIEHPNWPPPDPAAAAIAIGTLVSTARRRHGDRAVLDALARRERDALGALRVF